MTGSMHRPNLPHQILPLSHQDGDLCSFPRMSMGDIHQHPKLGIHHAQIGIEFHSGRNHAGIDGQGLAGLDDAGVGFFRGHGGRLP